MSKVLQESLAHWRYALTPEDDQEYAYLNQVAKRKRDEKQDCICNLGRSLKEAAVHGPYGNLVVEHLDQLK